MCSMYWNLQLKNVACPACGEAQEFNLQTHFNGEVGDCSNFYEVGQAVPNLEQINSDSFRMNQLDWFTSSCQKCEAYIDFDATIRAGVVTNVKPFRYEKENKEGERVMVNL